MPPLCFSGNVHTAMSGTKTYHLISVSLLAEQHEQGDQLVALREIEIALEAMCAALTAGRRETKAKVILLEQIRIIESNAETITFAPRETHESQSDHRRRTDGGHECVADGDRAADPADATKV